MTTAVGVQPKRKRGYARVAAIMQTGVEVFMEKGFDAATMTEIATRSGTAIASLYRFFPSKESLADALIRDYMTHAVGALEQLRARAGKMTLDDIAGALIDIRLELQSQRRFVFDLVEQRGGSDEIKKQFGNAMLEEMSGLLRDSIAPLSKAKSEVMARVLIHILKGVWTFGTEPPAARRVLMAELKELIHLYLSGAKRCEPRFAGVAPRGTAKSRGGSHE
jgi:AcrR family transcriptional regulator